MLLLARALAEFMALLTANIGKPIDLKIIAGYAKLLEDVLKAVMPGEGKTPEE